MVRIVRIKYSTLAHVLKRAPRFIIVVDGVRLVWATVSVIWVICTTLDPLRVVSTCGGRRRRKIGVGVLQPQLPQETKKCIITGSEKPHHALPRCCCGGSRSLADRWARDGPASYRLRIFISHTASPKSTFSTTRSHPYAYCEHRALYGLNQRVLLDTQRLYDTRTGFPSSEHNT